MSYMLMAQSAISKPMTTPSARAARYSSSMARAKPSWCTTPAHGRWSNMKQETIVASPRETMHESALVMHAIVNALHGVAGQPVSLAVGICLAIELLFQTLLLAVPMSERRQTRTAMIDALRVCTE